MSASWHSMHWRHGSTWHQESDERHHHSITIEAPMVGRRSVALESVQVARAKDSSSRMVEGKDRNTTTHHFHDEAVLALGDLVHDTALKLNLNGPDAGPSSTEQGTSPRTVSQWMLYNSLIMQ